MLFAGLYRLLAALGLDTPRLLALAPRLLQAAACAAGDVATYALAGRLFRGPKGNERGQGEPSARLALLCHLTSWSVFYTGTRTFATSLEAALSGCALALWPWRSPGGGLLPGARYTAALALAALACVVRPSAALLWAPLAACELAARDAGDAGRGRARALLARALPTAALSLGASLALDGALYGRLTCVPCRFLTFNLLTRGAEAYGTHPSLWYISSGLPTVLATLMPATLAGMALHCRHTAPLAAACACFVSALSCSRHKEFRFLMPLLTPACAYAGAALAALRDVSADARSRRGAPRRKAPFSASLVVVILPQLLAAPYFSLLHQAAPGPAMAYLADAAASGGVGSGGILMLTPCHETPGYSHLHAPVPLAILDCSPPWRDVDGAPMGMNERDAFFLEPAAHLERRFAALESGGSGAWADSEPWVARVGEGVAQARGLPSHVAAYDDVAAQLHPLLAARGYVVARRFFHAHFAVDRAQRELLIYERVG